MGGCRSKATVEEILAAFHTDEGFKAVAKRLGLSPNTLRPIWQEKFGEDAFVSRGKALQARAAAKTLKETAGSRVYKKETVPCSKCGIQVLLKKTQTAQLNWEAFVCDACKFDRACPVCGQLVDGKKGLAIHFGHQRNAEDKAHTIYQETLSARYWGDLVEGEDFVSCLFCGARVKSLVLHLTAAHAMMVGAYRERFPDAPIQSRKCSEARSEAAQNREDYGKGETKDIICPDCGVSWTGSKFLAPEMHDLRCSSCRDKAEKLLKQETETYWAGKTEPDDYVECRLCGWKGSVILGHVLGAHPQVPMPEYRKQFPGAPLAATGVLTYPTHRIDLTKDDLEPFKDEKGRVQVAKAAEALNCSWVTVLHYCRETGIPTRNKLAFQKLVLDTVSGLLGEPYKWEWHDPRIVNPLTGYCLFFDGFFSGPNLLVEVHGRQHDVQVDYWHKTRDIFEQMQERDHLKARMAVQLGFKMLTIRWNEPYTDVGYLRKKLASIGVL